MRLGKFNIFWVGQGNDALKAPHHTRVEGDQRPANPMGMLGTGCCSFENKRARDIAVDLAPGDENSLVACLNTNT
jgi:hypothetical protein